MRRLRLERFVMTLALLAMVLTMACGCWGTSPTPATPAQPSFPGVQLVIGAIDAAAALPAVTAQRGEWEASRDASTSILETPLDPSTAGKAHVILFRGDRLGDLMDAGALSKLPESLVRAPEEASAEVGEPVESPGDSETESLKFDEILPVFRDQVSKYGTDRVAFPLGGSALVLVYNRHALERPENQEAARVAGVALEMPTDWPGLLSLATFFQGRDWNGDGQSDHGIALPLGDDPEGVGDAIYLSWAAALGQHQDDYSLLFDTDTMEPRLESAPFVEAMRGLMTLKAQGPDGMERFDAAAAREAFRTGRVALLIDRAEEAGAWGSETVKSVGVAQLPGSRKVYDRVRKDWQESRALNQPSYLPFGGGWLVGISSSATGKQRDAAIDFARYLIGPDTSNRVRSDRDFHIVPIRSPQLSGGFSDPRSAPGVSPRAWSDAVNRTLVSSRVVPGLRIPDANGYLADLRQARLAALRGESVEAALKQAAAAWDARTKGLGNARQLWHYRRTLNSLVTTPEPPPRAGK